MKKIIYICLSLVFCISMSACSAKQEEIDINKLATTLLEEVNFSDDLNQIDDKMVERLYNINNAVSGYVYVGSGATAEEIAVFEFNNKNEADEATKAALQRIDDQKQSFESYVPKELDKLENAIVKTSGRYLIVCISDGDEAEKIIKEYIT